MDAMMEDAREEGFGDPTAEIDLDYEFDAPRHFDFEREESLLEACESEFWFEKACGYSPSPFIVKLNWGNGGIMENANVNYLQQSLDMEETHSVDAQSDADPAQMFTVPDEISNEIEEMKDKVIDCAVDNLQNLQDAQQESNFLVVDHFVNHITGANFQGPYGQISQDMAKVEARLIIKETFARGSTLMKPTASHLAKQNKIKEGKTSSRIMRFQKPVIQKNDTSTENMLENTIQASKRQKLDGGHLRKVLDVKQQPFFMRKLPQKKDGLVQGNSEHVRLKITIPREPELVTAQRAQRLRSHSSKDSEGTAPIFKARRMNRKEFHLKTCERAMQNTATASSSLAFCNNADNVTNDHKTCFTVRNAISNSKHLQNVRSGTSQPENGLKKDRHGTTNFKALPLNRKIFSSKGDLGVFRSCKQETTIPKGFNFSTDKRVQQNPPIELFSKLSLKSEGQSTGSQQKSPKAIRLPHKGSKENIVHPMQQENMTTHMNKERMQKFGAKQNQYGKNGLPSETRSKTNLCRGVGIR
ncbi:Protein TPX2 [Acorus gramineus]|uniref:Protein TPX2 n=1 Tax=Acorus gramineus TaxID=55184 RepID=A0AAV9ACR0_ACOGR|nr:Protein TPX2 [Acorus gramineus]